MKKILISITTLIMLLMMTTAVYAAPSVQLQTPTVKAVDADGKYVEIVVEHITDAAAAGAAFVTIEQTDLAYNLVKETYSDIAPENIRMISLMDVYIKGDASLVKFPVTLTFEVNSVESTTRAYVIHFQDNNWVIMDSEVGDGTITTTFNSLSPVSIFVDVTTLGDATDENSPNTGDNMLSYIMILGTMAAMAFIMVYRRKTE